MGIFDDIKAKGATYRLTEEALYAEALCEIESGQRRDGIWAKAMAESDMDAGKAGAKYIKMRVQSLKDEVTVCIAALNRAESRRDIAKVNSQKEIPKFDSKESTRAIGQFIGGFKDGMKGDNKQNESSKRLGLAGSLLLIGIAPFFAMAKGLGDFVPGWMLWVGVVPILGAVILIMSDYKKGR